MYLPYVRGKQFELLALKEMAVYLSEHPQIIPIIEPVRERGDALGRCLDEFALFGVNATVILNPGVGELAARQDAHGAVLRTLEGCAFTEHVRLGVMVRASTNVQDIRAAIRATGMRDNSVDFIHEEFAGENDLHTLARAGSFQVVQAKEVVRRYRPALDGEAVKLADRFPRKKSNLDYVDIPATLFTDDNIYFSDDGFAGFSDFATIGQEFSEGGSSPRAVVIHLTYQDFDDGTIWIRHFCSDSNQDTADTAGKFGEAVQKLVAFCHEHGHRNPAISAFESYARQGSYPGLGMVKKLSIQNHLYLISDALASAR